MPATRDTYRQRAGRHGIRSLPRLSESKASRCKTLYVEVVLEEVREFPLKIETSVLARAADYRALACARPGPFRRLLEGKVRLLLESFTADLPPRRPAVQLAIR